MSKSVGRYRSKNNVVGNNYISNNQNNYNGNSSMMSNGVENTKILIF